MRFKKNIKIAILITCHNRKKYTLKCIKKLIGQNLKKKVLLSIFLVDDGSIDKSSIYIKSKFPFIKIIQGNGQLFWTGGTNLAFKNALNSNFSYDYYLFLNNDTFLFKDSISTLLRAKFFLGTNKFISVGTTKNKSNQRTYGGMRNLNSKITVFKNINIVPNRFYQNINRFNGNIVLISKEAQKKIGLLNENLKHNFSDIEYGIRAEKKNIKMVICPGYQGICEKDKKIINFKDFILGKKIISSGFYFTRKYGGFLWPLHFLSLIYSFLQKTYIFPGK